MFACLFALNFAKGQRLEPSSEYYASSDSTKIYFEVIGTGKPVVLIHGFSSSGDSWKQSLLYNDLIRAGYKVITMDLRGNGQSDKPHVPEAYEKDAEAKDIIGIMNKLAVEQYDVIGYSRGAIIASRLLILDQRVNKTVLGGMGADFMNPQWPRRIMFYEALMGKDVKELEGMVKRIKDTGLDQLALAYTQKAQPSTSKEEFSTVNKPVLVISGIDDHDNGSSKDLAGYIANSVYVNVPGGHGGTARTHDFSAAVMNFLSR
jgi:pimeloyl-ACP methyl ester carboxylesterase